MREGTQYNLYVSFTRLWDFHAIFKQIYFPLHPSLTRSHCHNNTWFFLNFLNVSPITSLQRIWPPDRLCKEDNQVNWWVMLRPQQITWEESIHVKLYGQTDSKFQASNSTSRKIVWSFPRNQYSVVSFPINHYSLQRNGIWAGSKYVQLYCCQASNFQASNAIYSQSLGPQQGTWAESNNA